MRINEPDILAELKRCHELYERALLANDADALDGLFWDSSHALRFGVTENLHGAEEIRAFRRARPNINLAREIQRLDITSFGDSAGIVNLEFKRLMFGVERLGRQTQFWFRFDEGWRIASAHVSLLPVVLPEAPVSPEAMYIEAVSNEIGLHIDTENKAGVEDNLSRIRAIADFLMKFPLSQEVEAAPVFHP
jgi:hypothetical protein